MLYVWYPTGAGGSVRTSRAYMEDSGKSVQMHGKKRSSKLKFMGLQGLTKVCLVLTSCLGCCGGRGEEWPAKAQMFVHHSLLYLAHKHHYMRDIPSRAPHLVCQSVALLLCRCAWRSQGELCKALTIVWPFCCYVFGAEFWGRHRTRPLIEPGCNAEVYARLRVYWRRRVSPTIAVIGASMESGAIMHLLQKESVV